MYQMPRGRRDWPLRALLLIALLATVVSTPDDDTTDTSAQADGTAASSSSFTFDAFGRAFVEAFGVILATEVGDRTFFIAAIMAMRHSRFIVWTGAVGALVVMTVLATLVGHVAPLLISREYTQYAAAGLFLFFGVRMLRDGLNIGHTGASEELEEVEAELTKKEVRALIAFAACPALHEWNLEQRSHGRGFLACPPGGSDGRGGCRTHHEGGDGEQGDGAGVYAYILGRVGRPLTDRHHRSGIKHCPVNELVWIL
jgi:hypothetical protein